MYVFLIVLVDIVVCSLEQKMIHRKNEKNKREVMRGVWSSNIHMIINVIYFYFTAAIYSNTILYFNSMLIF